MTYFCQLKSINLRIFSQTKRTIGDENFVVVSHSSRPNVWVHVAPQHVNIFSNAVIKLARCLTKRFLVMLNVFLNIYSSINDILEIIQKSLLGS